MEKKSFINTVNSLRALTTTKEHITQYLVAHDTHLSFSEIDELYKQVGVGKTTQEHFLQHIGLTGLALIKAFIKGIPK